MNTNGGSPIGAESTGSTGVHFRVWAPMRRGVRVVFETEGLPPVRLRAEEGGYFSGHSTEARAGALYRFRLDDAELLVPDPASRFQPDGVHGASEVIDAGAFRWTDSAWPGIGAAGQVVYEMHVGTFTREGTWAAAERELPHLAELGITCLEMMPVCESPGNFGWGYDNVDLFAPSRLYGRPDDFRRFVDRAHAVGVGVILDVVYNHVGPDGNYLKSFSKDYFTDKHKNDWGQGINFDGDNCRPVREFFLSNVSYWMQDFHVDGFRFDATQAIVDDSPEHILAAMSKRVREIGGKRKTLLVNENEPQLTKIVRPVKEGGYGMDALWNDDFHHAAMVALTGRNEAYYQDYLGQPQEFISAAKWGYLFQGQRYAWQRKRRGTPGLDLPPTAFVHFIQNHDQIANSGRGLRAHQLTSPAQYRAVTALLLLGPQTPMLFQGQEYAAVQPFYYFADHQKPGLAGQVRAGRAHELSQFPSIATPVMQAALAAPDDPATFERTKLNHADRDKPMHAEVYQLHRDLLRLRKEEPTFHRVQKRGDVDGAVLGPDAFLLRYFAEDGDDRLLLVNLGRDLPLVPAPEPLLAPPEGKFWGILWSSEDLRYGGSGTAALETESEGWLLPGRSAVVLKPSDVCAEKRVVKPGHTSDI